MSQFMGTEAMPYLLRVHMPMLPYIMYMLLLTLPRIVEKVDASRSARQPGPQWGIRAAGTTGLDGAIGDAREQTARSTNQRSVPLLTTFVAEARYRTWCVNH